MTCAPNKKNQKLLDYCPRGPLESVGLKIEHFPRGNSYTVLSLNMSSRAPFHLPHLRIGCELSLVTRLQIVTARGQP